jgi:hypothetical protein
MSAWLKVRVLLLASVQWIVKFGDSCASVGQCEAVVAKKGQLNPVDIDLAASRFRARSHQFFVAHDFSCLRAYTIIVERISNYHSPASTSVAVVATLIRSRGPEP